MARTSGYAVKSYKYYDYQTKSVDFEGLKHDLEVKKYFMLKTKYIGY